MKRIGVDVGGTFTDAIFLDDETGTMRVEKVPTTADNPADGTLAAMEAVAMDHTLGEIDYIAHGTTTATNAILTHSGAPVGLITTKGFRDVLQIGRHKKPLNFSFYQDIPWQQHPIVERRLRYGVSERIIPPNGEVETPLDEDEVLEAVRALKAEGVEAIAICFLFSFLNPVHEQIAAEIVRREHPDAFVTVRSEILPQHREYEVFSTVALNAFVGPVVNRYISRLSDAVAGTDSTRQVHFMTSGGGVATSAGVLERPVSLVTSGPAAGLIGGVYSGRVAGFDDVITLDVGGTSADIGLCVGGELRRQHLLDAQIGGHGIAIPMLDLDTIGAGGGSIGFVDPGGVFRVGPESAGSDPGPACYGRGGERPTVTDAELVLGRLRPERPLAGSLTLDPELAAEAITKHVAEPLGLSLFEAAAGMVRISTELMIQSVEANSVRRGYDPRDFALVAMGGAGPLFAIEIAHEVGIPSVVVPPHPGISSALGLLASDVRYEDAQTIMTALDEAGQKAAGAAYERLIEKLREQLAQDGFDDGRIRLELFVDCRYTNQGYELTVPAPEVTRPDWVPTVRESFEVAHKREYGSVFEDFGVELVAVRVRASGKTPPVSLPQLPTDDGIDGARGASAEVYHLLPEPGVVKTDIFDRALLPAGSVVKGPALVEQLDSTLVIPPSATAHVLEDGTLRIDLREL